MPYALRDDDQKEKILAAYKLREKAQNDENLAAYFICAKIN